MQVRNIRPSTDAYEIAATGQVVERGDVVTVDDDLGLSLCDQPSNWAPDGDESVKLFVEFCRWIAACQPVEPDPAEVGEVDDTFVPPPELPNPGVAILAAEQATEAAAADQFTARNRPVTDELLDQLRAITEPTERVAVGHRLFGKRYKSEVAVLLDTNGQEG